MVEAEECKIQVPEQREDEIQKKVDQFDAHGQELGKPDGVDILGYGGHGHEKTEQQDDLINNLHPHNEGLSVVVAHEIIHTCAASSFSGSNLLLLHRKLF